MKKQFFTAALLAMAAWLNAGSAFAWDEPTQVDGVYQIGTASELEWFAEYVATASAEKSSGENDVILTSKAVLTADIDMTGVKHTPIGVSQAYKFNGQFDGQHHRIKNMTLIDETGEGVYKEGAALFGAVRGGTIIKNIIIDKSCVITAKGRAAGIIANVQTNMANQPLLILNCVNEANITSTGSVASGIIGAGSSQYPYFEMHNCVNLGNIKGASNNKGVAFNGWSKDTGTSCRIWHCYTIGDIGPLDGTSQMFRGNYRDCNTSFDLTNTDASYQGDHVTWATADPVASGELCWYLNNHRTNDFPVHAQAVSYKQEIGVDPYPMPVAEGKKVYQVADLTCDGKPKGSVSYSNTEGGSRDAHVANEKGYCTVCGNIIEDWRTEQADGYYHFSTVEEIEWWSDMVRYQWHGCMNVKLDADIDFGGVPNAHYPIGVSAHKWAAKFDGQGHHIKGMVITNDLVQDNTFDGLGFFGSVRGGVEDSKWSKKTNGAEIKNLFIDADCSINHTSNFAAGVVGHINSTFADAVITIENCGNAANIYTTGKNAAGILGCVEATNVGLKLHNLWNKGNITGKGGESAAICAWTGQRNVNGEVDVEGCWNIGAVEGVDGNGYNMIRRNSNIVPRNIVDLCITNNGNQGKVAVWNTEDPIASGELCYLLNGDQKKIVYTQNIDEDEMPVYGTTSAQVYKKTIRGCGYPTDDITYNNVREETIDMPHESYDEQGICAACHIGYQAPELVDGIYELSNAGNVEWFSALINSGTNSEKAKMTADIDFTGVTHTPIGNSDTYKFNGEFDGQGHRITNLIYSNTDKECVGFFGWLRGNTAADGTNTAIRNLIIDKSCSFTGKNKVGALAGTVQVGGGTITVENVVNEADVESKSWDAGAIFGGENGGNVKYIIRNVVNTGNITSTGSAGALCCYLNVSEGSLIENFLNLGTISKINEGKFNIGRHNIDNATNLIDLSDTEGKTQGVVDGLETEAITSGELAYMMGFKQLIGNDEYPSPLNEVEVKYVGEAGYATMVATKDTKINGNAKAYTARITNSYVTLDEVDDVPAGAAVILKGSYYNALSTTAISDFTSNQLIPVTEEIDANGTQYVLAKVDDKVGFYKAENGTIAAGKAYLTVAGSTVKAFYFEDETATGIVNANANTNANQEIYNLAGQRIQKMQQGINIVGGKKILK